VDGHASFFAPRLVLAQVRYNEHIDSVRVMDGSLDTLAAVSRLMFDQRILDLRKENEALQCQVALLRFGPEEFNVMLAQANDTGLTEICTCKACFCSKRFCQEDEPEQLVIRFKTDETQPCILKECLLWHADRLGLKYEIHREHYDSDSDGEQQEPHERDFDLVIVDHDMFWEVDYGRRLSADDFHKKPSLPELKSLFALMTDDDEFYLVNGKDYRALAENAV
jgi:hypothetical protein